MQNVTIGNTFTNSDLGKVECLTIGDNCLMDAGTAILENVKIENNVRVDTNSVILNNILDNVMVAGSSAVINKLIGD